MARLAEFPRNLYTRPAGNVQRQETAPMGWAVTQPMQLDGRYRVRQAQRSA